ncbi:MAG: hypothetical protein R2728_11330 [Chitinophagales bacterium]
MKQLHTHLAIILTVGIMFTACSVNEVSITDPQKVVERIDIKITNALEEYYYLDNIQENTNQDLVRYNFYGTPSDKIDYIIQLDNDKTLIIKLHNRINMNPWQYAESYGTFALQDLDDKFKYVTIEMNNGASSESSSFTSSIDENIPQGGFLDVFRIEKYDTEKMEMLCRINNAVLYQKSNPENSISINGTFRGSLTFLQ